MTKVVTKIAPIFGFMDALFVSTMNNEVIHQLVFTLNVFQGLKF